MAHYSHKPPFVDPAGDLRRGALPVRPPFLMNGVTSRVFPLKANMARLTQFVDQYVNMDVPQDIVHFRPAVPYVYLMVLDYGSMSPASVQAQNVGWVAQHEVAFAVPLERWRLEQGRLVFKGWACVCPFIFVDDEMSLTTGREVYGWPKVIGRVDAETPLWAHHPLAATRQFTFSTHVFAKVYAGEPESSKVLLQIDSAPAPSYSRVPPDPSNPWTPWSAAATALRSSVSLAGAAADILLALRVRGFRTNRDVASLRAMGSQALGYFEQLLPMFGLRRTLAAPSTGGPALAFENITVKQFRDAQEPDRACYKALVSSTMGIDRYNQSGLLGDLNLLRGDISGGYTLRIHRYTSQPIIESLGLEVAATEQRPDGGTVSILKPTFPFWTDVDLFYGDGRVICSRIHGHGDEGQDHWLDEQPNPVRPTSAKGPPSPGETAHSDYNTALGAATQPVAGPFEFPDVTLQVYPLLADRTKLDACIKHYLSGPLADTGLSFETFGSYAYMLVNVTGDQLGTMWSSANNIGWWAEREVSFCIPVKWYRDGKLISLALVAPFVYANNCRAVITDREVNGRPSIHATIESPHDAWLGSSGPNEGRRFLHMDTEAFPALHLGQKGELCTLLEIDERDVLPYNDDVGWRMVADSWGAKLVDELKRKNEERLAEADAVQDAKALALELLAHQLPFNWINLKQYRDANDTERACYQAAVHIKRSVTRIYDIREIEQNVHVRVHRLSGHPIVETLGLQIKSVDSTGGKVIDNLQPLRPFWMRVSIREELGTVAAWRTTSDPWHVSHPWFTAPAEGGGPSPFFRNPGETHVGAVLGQSGYLFQGLREASTDWLRKAVAAELAQLRNWALQPIANEIDRTWRAQLGPREFTDLTQLGALATVEAFCDIVPLDRQMALVLAVQQARHAAGIVSTALPAEQRRMTFDEAAAAIDALDEVQLVIESILGDEWENWGNPRRYRGLPPKPEPCIPASSIYGASWILNRNTDDFIKEHALSVSGDGLWYIALPGDAPVQQ